MTYNYQGLKPNYLPEDYEATDDFSPTKFNAGYHRANLKVAGITVTYIITH